MTGVVGFSLQEKLWCGICVWVGVTNFISVIVLTLEQSAMDILPKHKWTAFRKILAVKKWTSLGHTKTKTTCICCLSYLPPNNLRQISTSWFFSKSKSIFLHLKIERNRILTLLTNLASYSNCQGVVLVCIFHRNLWGIKGLRNVSSLHANEEPVSFLHWSEIKQKYWPSWLENQLFIQCYMQISWIKLFTPD